MLVYHGFRSNFWQSAMLKDDIPPNSIKQIYDAKSIKDRFKIETLPDWIYDGFIVYLKMFIGLRDKNFDSLLFLEIMTKHIWKSTLFLILCQQYICHCSNKNIF